MVYNPSPRGLDVYSLINVTTPFKSSTIKGSRNRILLVVLSRFRFIFKKTATIFQCITCELCIKIGEIHPRVLLGWTIVRTLELPKLWLFTIYRCAVKVAFCAAFIPWYSVTTVNISLISHDSTELVGLDVPVRLPQSISFDVCRQYCFTSVSLQSFFLFLSSELRVLIKRQCTHVVTIKIE